MRPRRFLPGHHDYVFGINFDAGQTLSYRVVAPSGPNTLLTVNSSSPRCNVSNRGFICARPCEAEMQAQCGWNMSDCTANCVATYEFLAPCESHYDELNRCIATLPGSAFECVDEFGYDVSGACEPQTTALNVCLTGG